MEKNAAVHRLRLHNRATRSCIVAVIISIIMVCWLLTPMNLQTINTSEMRKIFLIVSLLCYLINVNSQENIYPAKENKGITYIKNAIIHVGNGKVIENGVIKISNGKIEKVGSDIAVPSDNSTVVDAKGKHVYPGLILPVSSLGLIEMSAVRASNDAKEIGEMNPSVRSIVAYNADSKVINTLRSNGILLANVVPQGNLVAGSSSIVQLDAWNWEDAAYKTDAGMHLYMPSLIPRARVGGIGGGGGGNGPQQPASDPVKEGLDKIDQVKIFFSEAKAYHASSTHDETNLKVETRDGKIFASFKIMFLI